MVEAAARDTSATGVWMRGAVRTVGKMQKNALGRKLARARVRALVNKKSKKWTSPPLAACEKFDTSNVKWWRSTPAAPRDDPDAAFSSRRMVKVDLEERTVKFYLWGTPIGVLRMHRTEPPTLELDAHGWATRLTRNNIEYIAQYFFYDNHTFDVQWSTFRNPFHVKVDGVMYSHGQQIPLPYLSSDWTLPEAYDRAWERYRVILAGAMQDGTSCQFARLPKELWPLALRVL